MKPIGTLILSIGLSTSLAAQSVSLQSTTPGTQQTGNFNVSGVGISKVSDLGGQVFNVTAYGAVGDDSTDNLSAFNAAKAACSASAHSGGGTIYVPSGVFRLSGVFTNDSFCSLIGAGIQSTQVKTTSSTANVIAIGNPSAPFQNNGGLRDMTINSSVTRTAGYAVFIDGASFIGEISNLYINISGGGGMSFGATAISDPVYVHGVTIIVHGAFNGIQIDSGNDHYFSQMWIQGDFTAGSRGIHITSTGGDWFSDIESVNFEDGIRIDPVVGSIASWLHFHNVLADTNARYGFVLTGAGAMQQIDFDHCWAGSNGWNGSAWSSSGRGFYLDGGKGVSMSGVRIENNGGHGVEATANASDIEISGGMFTGNGQQAAGTYSGIFLTAVSGFRISNVRSGQISPFANQQKYGINISGFSNNNFIVMGNDTRSNVTGGISNGSGTGSTKIVTNNI